MEAIIIQRMKIDNITMPIPPEWRAYQKEWVEQESKSGCIDAQLLLGSDKTVLHPRCVYHPDTGLPIENNNARLLKSVITEKYLAQGFQTPCRALHINPLHEHDSAPITNSIQMQAEPIEIYISDSKEEDQRILGMDGIKIIDITSDEEDITRGHMDLGES